jgi:hypothetical protein
VVIAFAFLSGYWWRPGQEKRSAESPVGVATTEEGRRVEALQFFDEAVRARYEQRWPSAMEALDEAWRADAALQGVQVLAGQIGLERRDTSMLGRAARAALQRGENASSANLLLAVEAWMQKGELGAAKAGESAKQHLLSAVESEPSNAAAFFFLGELSRLLGENSAAHASLRGALHRQEAWTSSAVLGVKMQIAATEAAEAGQKMAGPPMSDPQGKALLCVRAALLDESGLGEAVGRLVEVASSLQCFMLLKDVATAGALALNGLEGKLHRAVDPGLPAGPVGGGSDSAF